MMFSPDGWIMKELWAPSEQNVLIMSQMAATEGFRMVKMKMDSDGMYCAWLVRPKDIPILKALLRNETGGLTDQEEILEVKGMLARSEVTANDLNFIH